MGRLIKNKTLKITIILCFLNILVSAQDKPNSLEAIPRETVHLSFNANMFLVGETLYYNFFCLTDNNTPSSISKIGYVELIGENGESLFKHKLKLEEGLSSGDFFIPSTIQSGQYKLVAYTKWMKKGVTSIFLRDVYIINPFLVPANNLESESVRIEKNETKTERKPESTSSIQIETKSNILKTKSLATIDLNNITGDLNYGNYSLSVRKVSPVQIQKNTVSPVEDDIKQINNFYFLPELRGEIISGVVTLKSNGSLLPNAIVSLSIPGKNFILKNAKTNPSGRFSFSLFENYNSTDVLIQVLNEEQNDAYKIVLDNPNSYDFSNLSFEKIYLNQNLKDWLVMNSMYNQIENAYFNSKKDSVISRLSPSLFYVKPDVEYVLDDYKRFPTIKETFIEIIRAGAIRKHKDKFTFKVFNIIEDQISFYSDFDPLVLFDGVLILDNQDIIDYDARNIERINIVRGTYFFGRSIYYGIVDIQTKNGDFVLPENTNNKFYFNLEAPIKPKNYYMPKYASATNDLNRIPDFRNQLLWQPNIKMDSNFKSIEFYTSGVTGIFEIVLEGFTFAGKHVISTKNIEVKN